MKWLRAGLLSLVIPCAAQLRAQVGAISGFCVNGAKPATTSGLNSSNFNQSLIPKCVVSVVLTGTTTPATIYSDAHLTALGSNFTANTDGSWLFYAAFNQAYDVTLAGGVTPNTYAVPRTLTGLVPGQANSGTATITPGTNIASAVCAAGYACTNTRGRITIVASASASTGTVATINFSTTLNSAPFCTASEMGATTLHGLDHLAPTTTGVAVTAAVSVASATLNVDYFCIP